MMSRGDRRGFRAFRYFCLRNPRYSPRHFVLFGQVWGLGSLRRRELVGQLVEYSRLVESPRSHQLECQAEEGVAGKEESSRREQCGNENRLWGKTRKSPSQIINWKDFLEEMRLRARVSRWEWRCVVLLGEDGENVEKVGVCVGSCFGWGLTRQRRWQARKYDDFVDLAPACRRFGPRRHS
jgi:hypothetical protein